MFFTAYNQVLKQEIKYDIESGSNYLVFYRVCPHIIPIHTICRAGS